MTITFGGFSPTAEKNENHVCIFTEFKKHQNGKSVLIMYYLKVKVVLMPDSFPKIDCFISKLNVLTIMEHSSLKLSVYFFFSISFVMIMP